MKFALGVSFLFFSTLVAVSQNKISHEEYIERYYKLAVTEMERSGVPASITLAQGILESGSGNSDLAKNANNHFGIKCHKDWDGKGYYMDDDAPNECFRVYKTPDESFHDHSDFIRGRPWYKSLFDLEITDYKGWAKGLKKAGYATNPKYAELLITLIERNELDKYDRMSSTAWLGQPEDTVEPDWESIPNYHANLVPEGYSGEVITVNGKKAIIYEDGLTPLAIALEHDVALDKLYTYNDLPLDEEFKPGTNVFLQPKKRKGPVKIYVAQKGESMWDIAQKFGIRLDKLYSRNNMEATAQVVAGETMFLRKKNPTIPKTRSYKEVLEEKQAIAMAYKKALAEESKPEFTKPVKETPKETVQQPTEPVKTSAQVHIVQAGDTLYSLALRYNLTVDEIKEINGLTSNNIKPGQELKVVK
jgi:LysM repeat protein